MSQLDLAIAVGSTSRHISFLETGRSRPSAGMVDRLADQLDVPVRDRNRIFEAAGLRGPYSAAPLNDPHMEPFRRALRRLLDSHMPYPGFAYDRSWDLVMANSAAEALFAGEETNVVRLLFAGAWRDMIENWSTVAWAVLDRLRFESVQEPDDETLRVLVRLGSEVLGNEPRPGQVGSDLAMCPLFVVGDQRIPTVSVLARFGTPRHVATDDIRVELVYPEDEVGHAFFASVAAGPSDARAVLRHLT